MSADDLIEIAPGAARLSERRRETHASSLPIRWGDDGVDQGAVIRGVDDEMRGGHKVEPGTLGSEPEPSASVRGWVSGDGRPRCDALFVLAGSVLGVSHEDQDRPPLWLALGLLRRLDAIGDPATGEHGAVQEVELQMEDGTVLRAGWTLAFCDEVVATLQRLAERDAADPESASSARSGPDVQFEEISDARPQTAADRSDASAVTPPVASPPSPGPREPVTPPDPGGQAVQATAPAAARMEPRPSFSTGSARPGAPAGTPGPAVAAHTVQPPHQAARPTPQPTSDRAAPVAAPAPAASAPVARPADVQAGTLELEDVVYLGGYPGHGKKRKKCTATLGRSGLDVSGPSDLHFRISWDVVRTIEIQNSDEARFRMNAKIHRDASALVVECDQGVTILLEARDCPTIALRAAIGQLLGDVPVVVV